MAFSVYITDFTNTVELDTEDLDVKSIFSLTDITDISARRNNINSITFKGTKTNNNAFGTFFDFGRTSDFSDGNKLLFNYNPLRTITALVYEDSELIFKGSLRITEINVDRNGDVVYNTILTSAFIDLKTAIQDKYLTDLGFVDLRHKYTISNITSSWSSSIEKTNVQTREHYQQPFQYGSGYVYPHIDYGYYFTGSISAGEKNQLENYKPSIFLREYLNRIFIQSELNGFTYEIKGDDSFQNQIDHVLVLNNNDGLYSNETNFTSSYSYSSYTDNYTILTQDRVNKKYLLRMDAVIQPPVEIMSPFLQLSNIGTYILEANRNFDTTARAIVSIQVFNQNSGNIPITVKISVVKRNYNTSPSTTVGWIKMSEETFEVANGQNIDNVVTVNVPILNMATTDQLGIMIDFVLGFVGSNPNDVVGYKVKSNKLIIPATATDSISFTPITLGTTGDNIIPLPPSSIKQIDFLKSVINQFNFIVYSENSNFKHVIFEQYDEFYKYTQPNIISSVAIDWTNKVDYTKGLKIKSNIDLPKSYLFTFKDDIDYYTDLYKKKYAENYGSLSFTDLYGLSNQKKVELIFSPLVNIRNSNSVKEYPALYKVESDKKIPTRTNIRLAYYNGVLDCESYFIYYVNGESYSTLKTLTQYPNVSNYYFTSSNAANNLLFNQPKEIYNSIIYDVPNTYSDYYINQVSELTNPDITYIDANVMLTPVDIANLDLRIPVYISTDKFNSSYFKVLKVEYTDSNSLSKVYLQKIVL